MDGTTSIITNADLIKSVRDTSTLADVSISTWSGVRTDNKLLNDLKEKHNASGDVGKVIKNLMAGADAKLKAVNSAFNACRTHHYQTTLPWLGNPNADRRSGARLLPNLLFDKYLTEMAKLRAAAMTALEEFIAEYPSLVEQAKSNLGGMADAIYPTVDEIRGRYNITVEWEPIPDSGSFNTLAGIRPEMLERLGTIMAQRDQARVEGANRAMWENVSERVNHLCERLSALQSDDGKPDDGSGSHRATRFHTSAVEHVRDLLTYLPGWNVAGDPRVAEITAAVTAMLDGVDAEKIKKSQQLRDTTLNQAQSVMEKLNQWGI